MFRASRQPAGPDPYLDIRIGLFLVGGVLGLIGMYTGVPVIISFGILALAIGMILRLVGRARAARDNPPSPPEDDNG